MDKLEDLVIYMAPASENTAIINDENDEIKYIHNFTLDNIDREMEFLIDNYDINNCLIFGPASFIEKPANDIKTKYNIEVRTEGV